MVTGDHLVDRLLGRCYLARRLALPGALCALKVVVEVLDLRVRLDKHRPIPGFMRYRVSKPPFDLPKQNEDCQQDESAAQEELGQLALCHRPLSWKMSRVIV
jgi:hypothetical protein